jgi:cytoskeletal protein RodZ
MTGATWIAEIHGIAGACTVPVGMAVDSITAHTVVLNWTAVSGAISYNIQYRKVGTTTWTTTTSTANTKKITGLVVATNYEFQVQAVCSASSSSAFSASTTFTTHPGVGVGMVAADNEVKVYPNPIWDVFTVEFPLTESCPLNISVVDMGGRIVKELYNSVGTPGSNVFSFNKANLATGDYMLVIRTNENVIRNEKIVVAR